MHFVYLLWLYFFIILFTFKEPGAYISWQCCCCGRYEEYPAADVQVFYRQPQCSSAPPTRPGCERADSWNESRDTTFSRVLSAEEFLAVSRPIYR